MIKHENKSAIRLASLVAALGLAVTAQAAAPGRAATGTGATAPGNRTTTGVTRPTVNRPGAIPVRPVEKREASYYVVGEKSAAGNMTRNGDYYAVVSNDNKSIETFKNYKDAKRFASDMNKATGEKDPTNRKGNYKDSTKTDENRGGNTPNGKNGVGDVGDGSDAAP